MATLLALVLDDAAALAFPLVIGKNIYADNVTGLAHMILEVVPLRVPVEIGQENPATSHAILVFL